MYVIAAQDYHDNGPDFPVEDAGEQTLELVSVAAVPDVLATNDESLPSAAEEFTNRREDGKYDGKDCGGEIPIEMEQSRGDCPNNRLDLVHYFP